jgi:hypothetical protein
MGTEIHGKTVGIVGLGRVGKQVCRYFQALGASIIAHDLQGDYSPSGIAGFARLGDMLPLVDILTIHVDLNDTTRGMIGSRELALMKPTAVLINTSRGAVVDERALVGALSLRRLAGAALDVFDDAAVVAGVDNLLVTPHIGGCTHESFEKTEVFLAGKVVEAMRGIHLGKVNSTNAQKLLADMLDHGTDIDPTHLMEAKGYGQVSDTGTIGKAVDEVISNFPKQVEQFRAGKEPILQFLKGMVMKATEGAADPKVIEDLLRKKLQ